MIAPITQRRNDSMARWNTFTPYSSQGVKNSSSSFEPQKHQGTEF